jgi:hypothetical protein
MSCIFESFDSTFNCKGLKKILAFNKPERCYLCQKVTPWAYKLCKSKSPLPLKGGKNAKKNFEKKKN